MAVVSGVCGIAGRGAFDMKASIERMAARFGWHGERSTIIQSGAQHALAVAGPPGTVALAAIDGRAIALQGHPTWQGRSTAQVGLDALCRNIVAAWSGQGTRWLDDLGGDFALAIIDQRDGSALIAIDRIGVRNIVHQTCGDALVFGPTTDVVAAHPSARASVDPQALYDYVYFHMVPGPRTIFREHQRLPAGHVLRFADGRATIDRYWSLQFAEEETGDVARFKPAFRQALVDGVAALGSDPGCGAFLSGGTDSSTVSGLLSTVSGQPPRTYSIGFDAAGYDEMEYARIAARHFKALHHEYYVTPDHVAAAVPAIAAAYDQPFGNASAVPAYYCARHAREDGVLRLLAGDGGDELFGGNDRYAKQQQLALYERVPGPVRQVVTAVVQTMPGAGAAPLLRRARSYVEQASLPMPSRYESYNLLERLGPERVFDAGFLREVDRHSPLSQLTDHYRRTNARSLINRMLALDIKFTLADNDLPKVTRTCDLAGIDVGFPLLHDGVVAFSTTLPPRLKLNGTRLRYFFKEALRDFLPDEIIRKQKHGFGLPAGLWLRDVPALREQAGDALAGLRARHIFRADLLDGLLSHHAREHPAYYGTLAWVLMMLEMWFRTRSPARPGPSA